MRKLVLILIVFIAVVTFIRAVDNSKNEQIQNISGQRIEFGIND
jgi:hypothetical protein